MLGYGAALLYRDTSLTCKLDLSRIENTNPSLRSQLVYGLTKFTLQGVPVQAVGYHYDGAIGATGILLSATHRIGNWDVSGSIRAMTRRDSLIQGATYFISTQVAYVYATSTSTLWFGIDGGILGSDALPQFDVYDRSYTTLPLVSGSEQNTGLSFFARVLVGTASIRASYNNVTGMRWYTVAYMPDIPGQFRLSLDWTFVD